MNKQKHWIWKMLLFAVVSGTFVAIYTLSLEKKYTQKNREMTSAYLEKVQEGIYNTLSYFSNPSLDIVRGLEYSENRVETFLEEAKDAAASGKVFAATLVEGDEIAATWPEDMKIDEVWMHDELHSISFAGNVVKQNDQLLVAGPVALEKGGKEYFVFLQPMRKDGRYSGHVRTYVPKEKVLEILNLGSLERFGVEYVLWRVDYEDGYKIIVDTSNKNFNFSNGVQNTIYLPGEWTLVATPKGGWLGTSNMRMLFIRAMILEGFLLCIFYIVLRYYEDRKRRREALKYHEPSGLYNEHGLRLKLQHRIQKEKKPVTLILLVVREYCRFEQMFGHDETIQYLLKVKDAIGRSIEYNSCAAYLGGGHFMVALLDDLELSVSQDIAKGLSIEFIWKIQIQEEHYTANCSYEIARYPQNAKTADMLIRNTIQSYYAKLEKESPVQELTQTLEALIRGENQVFFKNYTDHAFRRLALTLNRYRKKVEQLAYLDSLYSVGNRSKYLRDCQHLINYHTDRSFSCYYIDIVAFSKYNEMFGNEMGDQILAEVARRLTYLFREYLYRISGDIFVGIYFGTKQISAVIDLIRHYISEPVETECGKAELLIKCGISCYPDHAQNPEDLLSLMQKAVKYIKKSKKEDYIVCGEKLMEQLRTEAEIQETLREALENKTLEVWYQPIMNTKQDGFSICEALLRLKSKEGWYYRVDQVLSVAENQHMIDHISDYVLDEVCSFLKNYGDKLCIEKVNINYMPYQFMNEHFVENITAKMKEWGIDPHKICLEVIESTLIQSFEAVGGVLEELQEKGFSIALDDFGVGYSSLNSLAKLPVNVLKIDRSLVRQLPSQEKQKNLLGLIVEIAKLYGLSVVAEGVETIEELGGVLNQNIYLIQGYYYAKPMPREEVVKFLSERNCKG